MTELRLQYLWDPPTPSGRGRKPSLTLDDVVTAAVAVADELGELGALSIRTVARHLGVGAMTLYSYVPGKTELVDLVVGRVFEQIELPSDELPWRSRLEAVLGQQYKLLLAHPWLLDTSPNRMPLAPSVLDAQEACLRALIDAGLTARDVTESFSLLVSFTRGQAEATLREQSDVDATGQSSDEYWASMSLFWERYFDPVRYRAMTWVWQRGGFDSTIGFAESLAHLLDGVAHITTLARDPDQIVHEL